MQVEGCASRSRAQAEPLAGTASRADRWILLEQPGSWGSDALRSDRLDVEVAARLRTLAAEVPARVLLLRRPGRTSDSATRRTLLIGSSAAPPYDHGGTASHAIDHTDPAAAHSSPWLEQHLLSDVRELLDLDLHPLTDNRPLGGQPITEPVYLVCTNARRDPCCATYGRPVAKALMEVVGTRVWECSHLGGHRFAGTMMCLPDGQCYGRLDPDSARAVVDAHEHGRLNLAHWRGRSSHPPAVQAAEAFVREATATHDLDAVQVLDVHASADNGPWTIALAVHGHGTYEASVAAGLRDAPAGVGCGGSPTTTTSFALTSLRRVAHGR